MHTVMHAIKKKQNRLSDTGGTAKCVKNQPRAVTRQ